MLTIPGLGLSAHSPHLPPERRTEDGGTCQAPTCLHPASLPRSDPCWPPSLPPDGETRYQPHFPGPDLGPALPAPCSLHNGELPSSSGPHNLHPGHHQPAPVPPHPGNTPCPPPASKWPQGASPWLFFLSPQASPPTQPKGSLSAGSSCSKWAWTPPPPASGEAGAEWRRIQRNPGSAESNKNRRLLECLLKACFPVIYFHRVSQTSALLHQEPEKRRSTLASPGRPSPATGRPPSYPSVLATKVDGAALAPSLPPAPPIHLRPGRLRAPPHRDSHTLQLTHLECVTRSPSCVFGAVPPPAFESTLTTWKQPSACCLSLPVSPARQCPRNHSSAFVLYRFACSGHSCQRTHTMSVLSCLAALIQGPSTL